VKLPDIEEINGVLVVRDDRFPGGTKARVLPSILADINAAEFVYASPAYGYAQIALAYAAREIGQDATVFVAKRKELHPWTQQAKQAGAKIVQVPFGYLSNVQAKAKQYASEVGAHYLPFGFDFPLFQERLAGLARRLDLQPSEVWCVAGSGTLTRALQQAWPDAKFKAVKIGAEPQAGRASVIQAAERFEQNAKVKPPFPSCANYDAKAWRFIQQQASHGALFWNVAA
jgi:threonine dehydratase